MIDLRSYGLEESVGLHIILSNILWWLSLILVFMAYKKRHIWNVGDSPWTFLFLAFVFFGLRELGHLSALPLIVSLRYGFGTLSAIFMTSAMFYLFMIICKRKNISRMMSLAPFVLITILLIFWLYLYYFSNYSLKDFTSLTESIIWIIGSSIIIYTTYMLGTSVVGDFIKVFMFFQFSAYFALTWKILGLIERMGSVMPYSIREIFETLFGVFAILSIYILYQMLNKLAKKLS
ncbi:MAG TPA: hypothetical protein VIO11_09060 [Candidatus Methanoperedens sp.]